MMETVSQNADYNINYIHNVSEYDLDLNEMGPTMFGTRS